MEIYAENKKAYFNYEILEKIQAGLVLIGQEVKAIKSGRINLAGSYVVINNNELFLVGCNIPPYQPKNAPSNYNPERSRKLLLKKSEINYLIGKTQQKSLTLVPLRVYTEKAQIKLEFGIAKGKKKFDKRETIKRRDFDREIERTLKTEFL